MKLARRRFLHAVAGAATSVAVSLPAWALDYPTRPVRIVVGYPAGGPSDIIERLMAQYLSARLNQPFIVETRPGANSNVATEAALQAPPDGDTLIQLTISQTFNASLYDNLKFDRVRDLAPVVANNRGPLIFEANSSFPAKTVPEFIPYAKANPGKVSMAAAVGSPPYVFGELFQTMAGVKMLDVPYRGSAPALTDLTAGQVQVTFDPIPSSIGCIKAGKLRVLAVTTAVRSKALPDVLTVGEFVPGYEASSWQGLAAPKNTPPKIVDKLNRKINAALVDQQINHVRVV